MSIRLKFFRTKGISIHSMGTPMSTISPQNWQVIEGSLSVFTDDTDQLESGLDSLIADLDHVRRELGEKAETLEQQRRYIDEQRIALHEEHEEHSQAARQLELQEVRLREALAELDATRAQLSVQNEHAMAAADEQAQALIQQIQQERDALKAELEASRSEAAEFAELLAAQEQVSAADRQENLRLGQEVADLRDQLVDVQAENKQNTDASSRRVTDLEQERAVLEVELEKVRARAADLQEQLAAREQKMETQRDEMNDELRQLRKLVERSARSSETASTPNRMARPATDEVHQNPSDRRVASDPVVDSVMAQFAKLQKDVSARRKRTSG